jgi:hypothetical protein
MANGVPRRKKLAEWVRRYLPCEIAGTVGELGGAAVAYKISGSLGLAAVVATIGASVGYYAAAYVAAVRIAYRAHQPLRTMQRVFIANALAMRSVVVEFGPAEILDSLIIRPAAYYLGPVLFGGTVAGWIVAKLVADVGFYVLAIFSYERFQGVIVSRRPASEEVDDEPTATLATA